MNEQTEKREFRYTDEEAEIVARCELGVYDLPSRLTLVMVLALFLVAVVRIAERMPFPPLSVLGSYALCAAAWILFLVYLRVRIRQTKKDLLNRSLLLYYGEDGIEIYETAAFTGFHCRFGDITELDRGDRICRIHSKAGRICFPLRLLSAKELQELDGLETAAHVRKNWM